LLGETPHWQDNAALVLVVAALATVLMPAKPMAEFFKVTTSTSKEEVKRP